MWLSLLATWVLVLIFVAAGYASWNLSGLALHLKARSIRPEAGSPIEELPEHLLRTAPLPAAVFEGDALEIDVGLNIARFPRGPATVKGTIGGQPLEFGTGVVPREGWRQAVEVASLRRGPLGAASWRIETSDFVGFFRGRRKCPEVEVALVLPRFASLRERRRARELEASVVAPRAGSGSELFGVREYRPGDSLRRIHWRSSARHGELVVREYEPPGMQTLTVALDPTPTGVDVADQIARIAASEAWDCLREGGRVTLWAPGLEALAGSRDLWSVLEWLARYPVLRSGADDQMLSRAEEVVLVTAQPMDIAATRAWVVGDAPFELEMPFQRVGTAWPL